MQKKIALSFNSQTSYFKKYLPGIQILKNPKEAKNFDLIIFPGGEDVNPMRYNEMNNGFSFGINGYRDDFESNVFSVAYEANKKIIGICRGSQLLNVLCGGSLYQDIQEQATGYHPQYHDLNWGDDDSPFYKFFGKGNICSTHHQSIKKPGRGISVLATYKSIPEVSTYAGRDIYLFQFHPEFQEDRQDFFKYIAEEW